MNKKVLVGLYVTIALCAGDASALSASSTSSVAASSTKDRIVSQIVLSLNREAVATTSVFRLGVRSEETSELQSLLLSLGDVYPSGVVTGYYGPLTDGAVKMFRMRYLSQGENKTSVTPSLSIARNLSLGSKGDDVKRLQSFLARFPDIYPEGLVSGYFGAKTELAVKRFQKKNGLEPVGSVGPRTRSVLNASSASSGGASSPSSQSMSGGSNSSATSNFPVATSTAKTNTTPIVSYGGGGGGGASPPAPSDTTRPSVTIVAPAASTTLLTDFRLAATTSDNVAVSTLIYYIDGQYYGPGTSGDVSSSSVTVFKYLYATGTHALAAVAKDTSNNYATATVSVVFSTAVTISNIATVSTTTSATTTWTTDIAATSDVYYSTISPVFGGATTRASGAGSTTSHSVQLTGLSASTTYYYVVASTNNESVTATSTERSFVTQASASTSSAPIISSVFATTSLSFATTTWTTDIAATSDVYFSSTSPLFTATTTHVGVSGTSISHSVTLSGLNASTTYYFAVVSIGNGQTSTSSTQSFTTAPAAAQATPVSSVDLSSFLPQRPWGITMNGSDYIVTMVDLASSTGRLVSVTSLGVVSTIATFNRSIFGVGFDGTDYLVSDGNTNVIRVTQGGATSTVATGVTVSGYQSEIAMIGTSAVVTDYPNGRLRIVDSIGTVTSLSSGLGHVKSVTNDASDYVAIGGSTLFRVTSAGTASILVTSSQMGVVTKLGTNFYFTDGNNVLTKVSSGGTTSSGGSFSPAQIQGMTVSGSDIIGTDYTHGKLLRITPL